MTPRRRPARNVETATPEAGEAPARPARRSPGRPPSHDEAWTKVTVVLFNRQIVFLDRLAASIRANTGAAMSRAQIIRAVIDAVTESEVDLTGATSEPELKTTLAARIG